KTNRRFNRYSQILFEFVADFFAILISYFVQYFIRFETGVIGPGFKPEFALVLMTAGAMLVYWHTLFFFSGMYKNWYEKSPFDEIFTTLKVTLFGTALLVFLILSDTANSPRNLFILHFIIMAVSVIIGRTIARRTQKALRAAKIITFPAIILGTPGKAAEFFRKTKMAKSWGYTSIGIIITHEPTAEELKFIKDNQIPILGYVDDFHEIIDKYNPAELIISTHKPKHSLLVNIVSVCGDKGISAKIEPDLYDIFTGQTRAQNIYGIPLIEISTQLLRPWQEVIKRIFDILFSAAVLLIGLPVWLLVALIIKLESRGPVFYTQPRVGKDGKIFKIYKFRSMVKDADRSNRKWTTVGDPRVTRFGRFIRKTHIDEVPQFWNVLIGDMSVVGPRPEQPQYVEEFSKEISYYKRRLKVRPGITGWWQVKYQAHELNTEEIRNRLKDDFYYIENMSIKLDVEIIVRTVWCVVSGHGQT
ncbi:MAG: sugar transferase, partial [Candidatus Kapaibacterium sp.]